MWKPSLPSPPFPPLSSLPSPLPSLSSSSFTRQLDKMMLQVDLVQTLFERAGGAKSAGQRSTNAKQRRSKVGVSH